MLTALKDQWAEHLWLRAGGEHYRGDGMIRLKRVYEEPSPDDGQRVLVERLWPRGMTRDRARIDLWLREIAPSAELRKWFGHDPARWPEFQKRYWQELADSPHAVEQLRQKAKEGKLTLIYATRDQEHNGALVLKQYIERRVNRSK